MIFGRNRNVRHEQVALPEQLKDERDRLVEARPAPAAEGDRGPFDVEAAPSGRPSVDLGALRVPAVQGMQLRLDVEDATQRIVAVTVTLERSALQIQAFSAPRAAGVWDDLRAEIKEALVGTPGAQVQEQSGGFGPEVLTRIPATLPDGSPGWNVARFVGVDGPRWFVRGVFHGEAAYLPDAARALEDVFAGVVVVRGDAPLPPRELLPLRPPADAQPVRRRPRPHAGGEPDVHARRPDDAPEASAETLPERGPEITEIR